ncbi:MAG: hypothetical protein ACOX9C_04900 [Kiritimatiellia bacterium]|jgi:hypothetical protein
MELLKEGVKIGLTAFVSVMGVLAFLYVFVLLLQRFADDKDK